MARTIVLLLAANSSQNSRIAIGEEFRAIKQSILQAGGQADIAVHTWLAVRRNELLPLLDRCKPHIVHLSAHGVESQGLILLDNDGRPRSVGQRGIASLFRSSPSTIRLAIINACFSHTLAKSAVEHIDCAVGMNYAIDDRSAVEFSSALYSGIAARKSIAAAYQHGITALEIAQCQVGKRPELFSAPGIDPDRIYLLPRRASRSAPTHDATSSRQHVHVGVGRLVARASGVRCVAPCDPDDRVGDGIFTVLQNSFELIKLLRREALWTEYLARHVRTGQEVTVFSISPSVDPDSEEGRAFVRDLDCLRKLDDRNLVRIEDYGRTPHNALFLVLARSRGHSLRTPGTATSRLGRDRALRLAQQVLHGLAAAHGAGLIHGALTPHSVQIIPSDPRMGMSERAMIADFGLARLFSRIDGYQANPLLPLYRAPEQLKMGRADERSDLYSVTLVLAEMLTGRPYTRSDGPRRARILAEASPDLLWSAIKRGLAEDPEERFQTALELAAALDIRPLLHTGSDSGSAAFRWLAPFREQDTAQFFGRDQAIRDVRHMIEQHNVVLITAPPGTGKTSLLRAGIMPCLNSLQKHGVYIACRESLEDRVLAEFAADSTITASEALREWAQRHMRSLVVILDQVETLFLDAEQSVSDNHRTLRGILECGSDPSTDITLVLSIREDALACMFEVCQRAGINVAVYRLGPLARCGARTAIECALRAQNVTIDPKLMTRLLTDLATEGSQLGRQMGWIHLDETIYPPHLQLIGAILYDALGDDEFQLTMSHYEAIGGIKAVVLRHFDKLLDSELGREAQPVARRLVEELITPARTRRLRSEAELMRVIGCRHGRAIVNRVLEVMRAHGLLRSVTMKNGESGWELIHDSVIPTLISWSDRYELSRQSAKQIIRYHINRSRQDVPCLLSRRELREVQAQAGVVDELDAELNAELCGSQSEPTWTARALVDRSVNAALYRTAAVLVVLLVIILALLWMLVARALRVEQEMRKRSDLGRVVVRLAPFDWDERSGKVIYVHASELPGLRFTVHTPEVSDPMLLGGPADERPVVRLGPTEYGDDGTLDELIEARGGPAFLRVQGRGRPGQDCPPSWIRVAKLPGYDESGADHVVRVSVPTCRATLADTVSIPAGEFNNSHITASEIDNLQSTRVNLDSFRIDRFEVKNAYYDFYASSVGTTRPPYPPDLSDDDQPDRPATFVNWSNAKDYCRFFGKSLPTSEQWTKAARGGIYLDDKQRVSNPHPNRELPWGRREDGGRRANLQGAEDGFDSAAPAGSMDGDVSPYGVRDLAGNVSEWTRSMRRDGYVDARGGSFEPYFPHEGIYHYISYRNRRYHDTRYFDLGFRCVVNVADIDIQ